MTGLQWAVLQAYARTLPLGTERFRLRSMTYAQRPARMGIALEQAAVLGYTKHGRLTLSGMRAAWVYLDVMARDAERLAHESSLAGE